MSGEIEMHAVRKPEDWAVQTAVSLLIQVLYITQYEGRKPYTVSVWFTHKKICDPLTEG